MHKQKFKLKLTESPISRVFFYGWKVYTTAFGMTELHRRCLECTEREKTDTNPLHSSIKTQWMQSAAKALHVGRGKSLPSSSDNVRRKGGWLMCAHVCLTTLHWLLEERGMGACMAPPPSHVMFSPAQSELWAVSSGCKGRACPPCFSSWPPCNTHTPPPPDLLCLFPDCSLFPPPHSLKSTADRVSMIVSM